MIRIYTYTISLRVDQRIEDYEILLLISGATVRSGVHLAHGHSTFPGNKIMLGDQPTPITQLDLQDVHGHIFVVKDDNVLSMSYEYRAGSRPNLSSISDAFLAEFFGYLNDHNLTKVLGLQVRQLQHDKPDMLEFTFSNAHTLMIEPNQAHSPPSGRVTGWAFSANNGIVELTWKEHHEPIQGGNHRVMYSGKLDCQLEDLVSVLKGHGVF